jgi:uncharacterized membrane protein YphA (DoxX/SURF4 family)
MNNDTLKNYAPVLTRVAIALVFLWFGTNQILHTSNWLRMIPEYVSFLPFSKETLIVMHGGFEIVAGLLLLVGWQIRIAASLLTLNLAHIVFLMGYNAIGVRDFGLCLTTLSIAFHGRDFFSLDTFIAKKKNGQASLS